MMKRILVASLMMASMAIAGCAQPRAAYYGPPGPPPPGPPPLRRAAHEGYHDGMMAARMDLRRGIRPDADRHPRFRRPPVPPPMVRAYRDAFRDGYRDVYRHARRDDD